MMKAHRTPEARFTGLPDYPFDPHYADVSAGAAALRIHYLDEGPREAPPVVLLHGEPSWSFLYRKMIPILTAAGHRVVAPDLPGFGKSDKPTDRTDYTYERFVEWVRMLLFDRLDLTDLTLFGQDWGGLIGLRLAAETDAQEPERIARLVAANTFLPTGAQSLPDAFHDWQRYSQETPDFRAGAIVQRGTVRPLTDAEVAAYDAPFPDDAFKAGARQLPALVPTTPDAPAAEACRRAWALLSQWDKPFLTVFSHDDPIFQGADETLQRAVPGASGQPHTRVDGGHFLQEDSGEEIAEIVNAFIAGTAA